MEQTDIVAQLAELKMKSYATQANKLVNYMITNGYITKESSKTHYNSIITVLSSDNSNYIPIDNKSRRKKKDPNAPKRPPSSFFLFKSDQSQKIKDLIADDGEEPTIKAVAARAGEMWRAMSDDDKEPYVKEYQQRKAQYQEELASYKASKPQEENDAHNISTKKPSKKKVSKKNVEECPSEIPEEFQDNWQGPYPDTFLYGNVKGNSFETLKEAMESSNGIEESVGVTYNKKGYQVRYGYKDTRAKNQGNGLEGFEDLLYKSPNSEISFIKKSAAESYTANGPNIKNKKIKKETPKELAKETPKELASVEVEDSDITQDEPEPSQKAPKKKKLKRVKKQQEKTVIKKLIQEPDTDDEVDCVVENITVKKFMFENKKYLIDSNNKVYDSNTQDFVGKFENNSINFDAEDSDSDFSD